MTDKFIPNQADNQSYLTRTLPQWQELDNSYFPSSFIWKLVKVLNSALADKTGSPYSFIEIKSACEREVVRISLAPGANLLDAIVLPPIQYQRGFGCEKRTWRADTPVFAGAEQVMFPKNDGAENAAKVICGGNPCVVQGDETPCCCGADPEMEKGIQDISDAIRQQTAQQINNTSAITAGTDGADLKSVVESLNTIADNIKNGGGGGGGGAFTGIAVDNTGDVDFGTTDGTSGNKLKGKVPALSGMKDNIAANAEAAASAKSTADSAQTQAVDAKTTALEADDKAGQAQSTADTAASNAQTAMTDAADAKQTAADVAKQVNGKLNNDFTRGDGADFDAADGDVLTFIGGKAVPAKPQGGQSGIDQTARDAAAAAQKTANGAATDASNALATANAAQAAADKNTAALANKADTDLSNVKMSGTKGQVLTLDDKGGVSAQNSASGGMAVDGSNAAVPAATAQDAAPVFIGATAATVNGQTIYGALAVHPLNHIVSPHPNNDIRANSNGLYTPIYYDAYGSLDINSTTGGNGFVIHIQSSNFNINTCHRILLNTKLPQGTPTDPTVIRLEYTGFYSEYNLSAMLDGRIVDGKTFAQAAGNALYYEMNVPSSVNMLCGITTGGGGGGTLDLVSFDVSSVQQV